MAQTQVLANPALVLPNGTTEPAGPKLTDHASILADGAVKQLLVKLRQRGIQVHETDGVSFPTGAGAEMHDRAAAVPTIVVSPKSEWGVSQTLSLLKDAGLYGRLPVSVKSGGHGYFNGATCNGIMLNLADMTRRRVDGEKNIMALEPGCVLGQTIHALAAHKKAVPHGDCFGVGAGGHFLTAGWDLILGRKHGLGCQSVVGGRVVLWDGSVLDVDEETGAHPDLLFAMRGGAAAGVGVVVETRLRLLEEPALATWRFTRITRAQLADVCVANGAFARAYDLPREVSVSFRFHFEPDQPAPVASFNVVSLLGAEDTVELVRKHMGDEVAALVDDHDDGGWQEKSLVDLRMLPASDHLAANPAMLGEVTAAALHANPLLYWKETSSAREMASSFFTSVSDWVVPQCEAGLLALYDKFATAQDTPARRRMYALVIQGGGRISELQARCSMPLGRALARFELHWDEAGDEEWSRAFTDGVLGIIRAHADESVSRPYRGDIWLASQAGDKELDRIAQLYDRR